MTAEADTSDLMLVAPVRTPIDRFRRELASLSAVDLGVADGMGLAAPAERYPS